MAITRLGLRTAEKTSGESPVGTKTYLVGSDVKISDNIDEILDATYGATSIPATNSLWDATSAINLRAYSKRAQALDEEEGTQEGFWWLVTVSYNVPDLPTGQDAEDPRDRDWLWAKSGDKDERVIANSLFDTSGYVYPETTAGYMINRKAGDAIVNTAGEPPEGGVVAPFSNMVIQLQKFVTDYSDLGLASWDELDGYIDTINDDTVQLLDQVYNKWELLMDEISYEPYSENGYDCIKVNLRIIANNWTTHVFTFPSAGYNKIGYVDGEYKLVPARYVGSGEDPNSPRLLDEIGDVIPIPQTSPFIKKPFLISVGRNRLEDWSLLTIPSAIP